MRYRVLFLVVAGLLICSLAYADVPRLINFQGRLTDASGKFVADGNYTVTFSIYSVPAGGSALWTEAQSVAVAKGLFNVILGTVTPIPNTIFDSYVDTYLGIQVAADPEMTPRQRLTSLGYSYYSLNSDKLDGLHASDFTSPVSDFGRSGVAADLYEGTTALTNKYVNVAGPDSVYSSSSWAFKGKSSGSSVSPIRGIYGYGDNTSSGPAIGGNFETSSNGTGAHGGVLGVSYGSSSAFVRGTEGDAFATSTGDAIGIFGWGDNNSSGNAYGGWFNGASSGSGTHYGIYSQSITATSNAAYGSYNYATSSNGTAFGTYSGANQSSTGQAFGAYGSATNSSSGYAYGGYFLATASGTGYHTGVVGSGITSSSSYADGVDGYASSSSSGGAYAGYFLAYSSGTGTQYGVQATGQGNSSASSYGVSGFAYNTSSGTAFGGRFSTADTGTGIHYGVRAEGFGKSSSATYGTYALGDNNSSGDTYGIRGQAQNTGTGSAFGGYFSTFGSTGSGWHYGVYSEGRGSSINSTYALYCDADNSSSGDAYGGYFITSSSGTGTHYGVKTDCYGASSAYAYGSYSKAFNSSTGTSIGSYGYAQNSSNGEVYAGWFETDAAGSGAEHIGSVSRGNGTGSTYAVGCFGDATNDSTGPSYGGYFRANSEGGSGTKYGMISFAEPSEGYAGYFYGDVTITDSLIVLGGKSAAVKVDNGEYRLLYSQESPENWFEDFGEGTLVNGKAVIQIDPLFAQTVNTSVKYHVFPMPEGDCKGLYVTNKTSSFFEIRELQGGNSNISFSYRIVAKRKGYENLRLAKMGGPTPEEVSAEQARFRTELEKSGASMRQEKPQPRPQIIENNEVEQNLREEQIRLQQENLIRQKNRVAEKQNIEKDKQPMQAAK